VTQDERQVLSDLYLARTRVFVGAVKDEYAAEAQRLAEQGWLERRFHHDTFVYGSPTPASARWSSQASAATAPPTTTRQGTV
jgi:hypothetical protein